MKSHFKTRKLRLESLEERALLAVTSAVFEQAAELAAPTSAASWVVNTTDDPADWDSTDDILSLREAIAAAKTGDTITFDASLAGKTITLAGTELEITRGITIDASSAVGITINANQKSRVFYINISDEGDSNTVKLVSLKITGGNTDEEGGGIWNENAELTIVNSVIYGNVAEVSGGGIESSSSLTVINSTISGNSASGEDSTGGGINSLGDVTLTNTIVSFNYAVDHNNVYTTGNPPVRTNSIVNDNDNGGSDEYIDPGFVVKPVFEAGVLTNADSLDLSLRTGSAAINAGTNDAVQTDTDIAGNPRIADDIVDIGAYEYQKTNETPSTVVTTEQDIVDATDHLISLREAISYAAVGDTITFDDSLAGKTITLAGTELEITRGITIDASSIGGMTIDADFQSRVFYVSGGSSSAPVELIGLTITGGEASSDGGGIYNSGTLLLTNCTVSGNWAGDDGGGIYSRDATLVITNSTVKGNSTNQGVGGGICTDEGSLTIIGSTITANSSEQNYGGGIYGLGELSITNSVISGNSAYRGGGIYNHAIMNITNSVISGNSAKDYAGGIENYVNHGDSSTLTIINSTISGNYVTGEEGEGGGIANNSLLTLTNTIVSLNYASIDSNIHNYPEDASVPAYSGSNDLVDTDPGFVAAPIFESGKLSNADTLDLSLAKGSAAINAGTNDAVQTDTDIAGNPRIAGGTVDIGAYESSYVTPSFTFSDEKVTYDGNPHKLTVSGLETTDKVTYDYKGTSTTVSPSFSNAGIYEVTATVSRDNTNIWTGSATLTIEKASITDVTFDNQTIGYDGKAHTFKVNGAKTADKVTYQYNGKTYTSAPSFTQKGDYEVTATVTRANYADWTKTAVMTIQEGIITDISFNDQMVGYDGKAHTFKVNGAKSTDKVTYQYNGKTYSSAPSFTQKGDYEVTATVSRANCEDWSKTAVMTIQEGIITGISFKDQTYVYSGANRTLTLTGKKSSDKVTYEYDGKEYSSCPKFTDVGSYEVFVTVSRANYEDWVGSATLTIEEKPIYGLSFNNLTYTYNGKERSLKLYGTRSSDSVTYEYNGETFDSSPTFTEAGVYNVTVTVSRDNCKDWTKTARLKINGKALTGVYFAGKALKYDTDYHSISVSGLKSGDTVTYTYNGQTYDECPEFADAGTYKIKARVSRENCKDWTGTAYLTITKTTLKDLKYTNQKVVYDGDSHSLEIDGLLPDDKVKYIYKGKTYTECPTFTNVGTYTVVAKVSRANYFDWTGTAKLTIEKGIAEGLNISDDVVIYDGQCHSLTVDGLLPTDKVTYKCNGKTYKTNPKFTNAGVYSITATVSRANFKDWTGTAKLTIEKAQGGELEFLDQTAKYDGKAHKLTIGGLQSSDKVKYSYNGKTYSSFPTFTKVGTYEVTAMVTRTNYDDWTGTATLTIEPGTITNLKFKDQTYVYNGAGRSLTLTGKKSSDKVTYEYDGKEYSSCPKFTDVGSYEVFVTVSRANYEDWVGSATLTIEEKPIYGLSFNNLTYTYNGKERSLKLYGTRSSDSVTYEYNGETFDSSPTFTEAGVYNVTVTVSRDNCKDWTKTARLKINGKALTGVYFAGKALKYDTDYHSISVSGLKSGDTVTYTYNGQTYDECPEFADAGTYKIKARVSRENCKDWTGTAYLTITKTTLKDLKYTNQKVVYDGDSHSLEIDGLLPDDKVKYIYKGKTYTECPTFTNVGTYTVVAKVSRANYFDWTGTATLTIKKAAAAAAFSQYDPDDLDTDLDLL